MGITRVWYRAERLRKPKSSSITLDDILEHWVLVESDFQREYHIDVTDTPCISWRRFTALFSGLSGDSTFFTTLREKRKNAPIENTDSILSDMMLKLGKK